MALIFEGIKDLQEAFRGRRFTIDGRLVGDIGEVIAEIEYNLILHTTSHPNYDADTPDGRKVQIKATFQNHLTFKKTPDYYLGFKLHENGTYDEVFNGLGKIIYKRYKHRKNIGELLLRFPMAELKKLSETVLAKDRVPRRKGNGN